MVCRRKVTISKFTGKPTVNIREYYEVRDLINLTCSCTLADTIKLLLQSTPASSCTWL